jgi:hypothetical protein
MSGFFGQLYARNEKKRALERRRARDEKYDLRGSEGGRVPPEQLEAEAKAARQAEREQEKKAAAEREREVSQRAEEEAQFKATAEAKAKVKAEAERIIPELQEAIDRLNGYNNDADPQVERNEVLQLLQRANALAKELEQPDGRGDLIGAAATMTHELNTNSDQLLQRHKDCVVGRFQIELEKCQSQAFNVPVELDKSATIAFGKAIETYRGYEFFAPPRVLEEALFNVKEALNYSLAIAATETDKLKIGLSELEAHKGVCGAEQVLQLLTRIKPGRLSDLGPGPMGLAEPKYNFKDYPDVEVEKSDGGYRLKSTNVTASSAHECTVMPIGAFSLGKIEYVDGESVSVVPENGGSYFRYRLPGADSKWVGKTLKRGVTKETYREVELRELEHLVDFDFAFQLGPVALARPSTASRQPSTKPRQVPLKRSLRT